MCTAEDPKPDQLNTTAHRFNTLCHRAPEPVRELVINGSYGPSREEIDETLHNLKRLKLIRMDDNGHWNIDTNSLAALPNRAGSKIHKRPLWQPADSSLQ